MTNKTVKLIIVLLFGTATIYRVSNWWEREFATFVRSETSPDGCMRIDTYKPFWVLPSMFHISPHPDPEARPKYLRSWESAVFRRAYEIKTGHMLGETVVFDPVGPAPLIDWGDTRRPGRRIVFANQFPIVDTTRCSDADTLARLEAFYETERAAGGSLLDRSMEDRGNSDPNYKTEQ